MSLLISFRSTSSISINYIKLELIGTIPGPRRVGVKHAPKSPNRQTLKSYNLASPWTIRSTWRAKSLLLLKECMLNSDTSSIPADSRHHCSVKATSISAFTDHYLNTVQSKLRTLPTTRLWPANEKQEHRRDLIARTASAVSITKPLRNSPRKISLRHPPAQLHGHFYFRFSFTFYTAEPRSFLEEQEGKE